LILLDTNVISELARPSPDPGVVAWLDSMPAASVGITSVTVAELLYGVARLTPGRRRTELAEAVRVLVTEKYGGRVWPFDVRAAACYALIVTGREQLGRRISMPDAQIAAICRACDATLATRNMRDFIHTGIDLINPWKVALPLSGHGSLRMLALQPKPLLSRPKRPGSCNNFGSKGSLCIG
jgi:predicted nucleic acid-binding protein